METYTLDAFPPNVRNVHVAYFEDVKNAPEIRRRLVDAARSEGPDGERLRAQVDFAFVEAGMIVSKQHLTTALLAALLTSLPAVATATLPAPPAPKTRSHNLHSEVLCALSPNNNITDAIRRFGVGDATSRLVVVRYGGEDEGAAAALEVFARMKAVVDGELRPLDALDDVPVDWPRIDKVYKLAEMNQLKLDDVPAAKRAAVVNAVAVKHAM